LNIEPTGQEELANCNKQRRYKYSRTPLIQKLVIRIDCPFGQICREFYKTNLPWHYRLSDQIHYSVMASRTSNQA